MQLLLERKKDERIDKEEEGKVHSVAVVSVKDQGEGISQENRSRLFAKFSSNRERRDTGLDLFLPKTLSKLMAARCAQRITKMTRA